MLFDKYNLPFYNEDGGATGGSATSAGSEAGSQQTTSTETTGVNTGVADQTPDGSKPNAAWAEMRRRAQQVETYESKLKKLEKYLPDNYSSIDEFLEAAEKPHEPDNPKPANTPEPIDQNRLIADVLAKVQELPAIKNSVEEQRNKFLVNSFKEVQGKFSDIQKAEDIPLDVWNAWDEGKSGRSLLSHLKEYRYDNDIDAARKQGANATKSQSMSVAHTGYVQGTNPSSEHDNIVVPDDVREMMMRNSLFRKKVEKDPNYIKKAYAKYHRQ